ncbi:glycosyl transferase family 2 [Nonlabens xylanidelens]|uniref:Glycosyl transferase family 2 n=1 Tax=Nonlabens xylanidelens TaxID=191564 RepID=A0A2S6IGC1_9FLAO|nr:glycosyltransferase [Nonlabens xylanidelens]PPK93265.1 glycosyl transferase family 2 [Nonlabens xylanidelens]PQJ20913.1 hypothetical protein BST94_05330 [Nonlabens xylanidelens]
MSLISVILPAYNAEKYLAQAIDSILNQTCLYFELIIINDGSTDRTEMIIQSYSDNRIKYYNNEINLGLIGTLNRGLELAKGKYIARMDADDISFLDRFHKQFDFLENNEDYVICSSSRIEFYQDNTKKHITFLPETNEEITIAKHFSTPFTHPAVMMRNSVIKLYKLQYLNDYKYSEDYEFWIRLLEYGKGYNFVKPLISYRIVQEGQTSTGVKNKVQRELIIKAIQKKALLLSNIDLMDKDLDFLFQLSLSDRIKKIDLDYFDFGFIISFFRNIQIEFKDKLYIESSIVNYVLGLRYLKIIIFNRRRLKFFIMVRLIFDKLFIYGILSIIRNYYNYYKR